MNDNYSVKVYSSFSTELEKTWVDLEKNNGWSPFQSFYWLSHWYSTVGQPLLKIKPQVVVISSMDIVIGLFPLGVRINKSVKILEWLGGIHADFMGPILHKDFRNDQDGFMKIWTEVQKKLRAFDFVHLKRQPEKISGNKNPFVLFFPVKHFENAFQANLIENWEHFYKKKVKKKIQMDSRRQRIRIAEQGNLTFKIPDSEKDCINLIQKMIAFKRMRYQLTGVADLLASQKNQDFYLKLPGALLKGTVKLHCAGLFVDNEIIAAHVGAIMNNTFYYLMPANDSEKWKRYSPGRLLLENLIEWSYQTGLAIFDFTIGDEEYKKNWCDEERPLYEYMYALNLKGKIYHVSLNLIQRLRKMQYLKVLRKKARYLQIMLSGKVNNTKPE